MPRPDPSTSRRPPRRPLFQRRPALPLSDRERLAGFAAAAVAAVAFAVIWVPHLGQHVAKNQRSATSALVIGLSMAALLVWGAFLRKRWILAVTALYVGILGPWSHVPPLGAPFLALAAWLTITASKAAAEARQSGADPAASTAPGLATTGARSGAGRGGANRSPDRGPAWGRRGRQPGASSTATAGARSRPGASKRYTPPKPPPRVDTKRGETRRAAKG